MAGISEISAIIGAIGAVTAAGMSFYNSTQIQEVHIALNSRLTELLSSTANLAREQGAAMGRTEGRRDTANERNKEIKDTASQLVSDQGRRSGKGEVR